MKISSWILLGWGLLAAACSPEGMTNRADFPVPAQLAPVPVPDRPSPVERQSPVVSANAQDRYIAVIAPVKGVDLAPRFAGELRTLSVHTGDRVEEGAVIAQIDSRQLQEELAVAEAGLNTARAAQSQAKIDVADAERVFANEKRAVARGVSAKQNIEKFRFAVARARAVHVRVRATIAEQELRVNKVRNRLMDAQIRAPFSGVIAARYRDPGVMVDSRSPVVRLIANAALLVRFAIPLAHTNRLAVSQTVAVGVANIELPLSAVIHQIAPELDPASKLIFVEAELKADEAGISAVYPGTAAWVTIPRPASAALTPAYD